MINKNLYNQVVSFKIFQQVQKKNIPKELLFESLGSKIDSWEFFFKEKIDWDLFTITSIARDLKIEFDKIIPTASDLEIKNLKEIQRQI